ncbi:MAG: choice-of-anchor L domain-containing protein [Clostridia bacterium]|nr:choice-of-anchor L domain-containing protein [Clostridia bacterium]
MRNRIRFFALVLALIISLATVCASAATVTENGLEVTLVTDENAYKAADPIKAMLTVLNNNPDEARDLVLKYQVPSGYVTENGVSLTKNVSVLPAGQKASFTITFIPSNNPPTGDSEHPLLLLIMFAVSGAAAVYLIRHKKAGRFFLSLMLCVALLGSAAVSGPIGRALADGNGPDTINIKQQVTIAGTKHEIQADVEYSVPGSVYNDFELRTEENVRLIGDEPTVMYLETKSTVGSITLRYGEEGNLVNRVEMRDDGKGTDDIAGDCIYTAAVDIPLNEDTEISFRAQYDNKNSNTVKVKYYTPISDNTLSAMDSVGNAVTAVMKNPGSAATNGGTEADRILKMLNDFAESGKIKKGSIHYDAENETITFTYPENILGGVCLRDFDDEMPQALYMKNVSGANDNAPARNAVNTSEIGTALILNAFPAFETTTKGKENRTAFYVNAKKEWDAKGLKTTLKYDPTPTVADFHSIGKYNVVCIASHGSYDYWEDIGRTEAVICLAELVTSAKNVEYQLELKDQQVTVQHWGGMTGFSYNIVSKFFTDNFVTDSFDSTFIYSECCEALGYGKGSSSGSYDYRMANAFINCGAKAYIGFHNSVLAEYSRLLMKEYVDNLIAGKTSKVAYDNAINKLGANHAAWFLMVEGYTWEYYVRYMLGDPYDALVDIAYPVRRGADSSKLVNPQLKNGGFETYNSSTTKPGTWTALGDVRTVQKLGAISPATSGSTRMALLTTGIGAQQNAKFGNGKEGSMINQVIYIPSGASTLEFDYDFVSEEPMEYVGNQFNDSFVVRISTGDTVRVEKQYASVNTSTWKSVSGVNFTGGDSTVYHTGWQHVSINLNPMRTKTINLQFIVYDVGDSYYDSACLIDNVKIK